MIFSNCYQLFGNDQSVIFAFFNIVIPALQSDHIAHQLFAAQMLGRLNISPFLHFSLNAASQINSCSQSFQSLLTTKFSTL
jgi:hypothetical protein